MNISIQQEQFIRIFEQYVPSQDDFLERASLKVDTKPSDFLELYFKKFLKIDDFYSRPVEDNICLLLNYMSNKENKISTSTFERIVDDFVNEIRKQPQFDKDKIQKIIPALLELIYHEQSPHKKAVSFLCACLFLLYKYDSFEIYDIKFIPKDFLNEIILQLNKKNENLDLIYSLAFINILPKRPMTKKKVNYMHLPDLVLAMDQSVNEDIQNILIHIKFFCQHVFKKIISSETISIDDITLLTTMLSTTSPFKSCFSLLLLQIIIHPHYYQYFFKFLGLLKGRVGAAILRSLFDFNVSFPAIYLLMEAGDHIYQTAICCSEYLPNYFLKQLQLFQDPFISKDYGFLKIHVTKDNLASFLYGIFFFLRIMYHKPTSVRYEIIYDHISNFLDRLAEAIPLMKNIGSIQYNQFILTNLYNDILLVLRFLNMFKKEDKQLFIEGKPLFEFIFYGLENIAFSGKVFEPLLKKLNGSVKQHSAFYMEFLTYDLIFSYPITSGMILALYQGDKKNFHNTVGYLFQVLIRMNNRFAFKIALNLARNFCLQQPEYLNSLLGIFLDYTVKIKERKFSLSILSRILLIIAELLDPTKSNIEFQSAFCKSTYFIFLTNLLSGAITFVNPINDHLTAFFLNSAILFYYSLIRINIAYWQSIPMEGLFRMINMVSGSSAQKLFEMEKIYWKSQNSFKILHQFDWYQVMSSKASPNAIKDFMMAMAQAFPNIRTQIAELMRIYQAQLDPKSQNQNNSENMNNGIKFIVRYRQGNHMLNTAPI